MSKVTKKIQVINIKPSGDGMRYSFMTSDNTWYSTFDQKTGKHLENLEEEDIVEIDYIVNKKGFNNFTSLKPVEDDQEFQQKEEKREDKKGSDIHRQCAGKIAAMAGGWFDLKGLTEEARAEKFVEFWKTVEDRLNEL